MEFKAEVTAEEWQLLSDTLQRSRAGWNTQATGRRYMIRDTKEGKGWWRQHGHGYTQDENNAGLFSAAELDALALDDGQVIRAVNLVKPKTVQS